MTRYEQIMGVDLPHLRQDYTARDTTLYALGIGAAQDPGDAVERRLVYEDGLVALPSMAVTLAWPGAWFRDSASGLDFTQIVHASERIELDGPLPVAARVSARARVVAIHDKGPGRGSLLVTRREVMDDGTGRRLAMVQSTVFCRGDGGLGGPLIPPPGPHPIPDRAPDRLDEVPTDPRAALIYRLSGDDNPLHVDPDVARAARFPGPILHGLSTYGHVCRVIMRRRGFDAHLRVLDCRFVGPVFPGEALRIESWIEGARESFRVFAADRRVIDNGLAVFA